MIHRWPFKLDRFQEEAIAAVDAGHSVLVAAPTSSGKTVVAEHAIGRAMEDGLRTFYTAPIKALSRLKKYAQIQPCRLTGNNWQQLATSP